jgi:hypothetical protein
MLLQGSGWNPRGQGREYEEVANFTNSASRHWIQSARSSAGPWYIVTMFWFCFLKTTVLCIAGYCLYFAHRYTCYICALHCSPNLRNRSWRVVFVVVCFRAAARNKWPMSGWNRSRPERKTRLCCWMLFGVTVVCSPLVCREELERFFCCIFLPALVGWWLYLLEAHFCYCQGSANPEIYIYTCTGVWINVCIWKLLYCF